MNEESPTLNPAVAGPQKPRPPLLFIAVTVILTGVFLYGLRWVFSLGAGEAGSAPFLIFDYAVGLTMIFLPCTLPLAFVIVPMVMGKSYLKGIGMALSFGLGVSFTLSLYGVLIGIFGQALGVHRVETAKNILYAIAGAMAFLFALGELGLIRFRAPVYGGNVPQFILRQKDYFRAGLMGLFLGNVGVGCPNPLFNAVIIPQIIVTGSPFQGWIIMFVQALGRITPLFILAFLAILGINATKFLVRHKDKVAGITAWSTIFVGGFLLTLGLFGHDGWVLTGLHTTTEFVTQESFITDVLGGKVGQFGHGHGLPQGVGLFGMPIQWAVPALVFIWILPMIWYWIRKRRAGGVLLLAGILVLTVFGFLLPHMYRAHWAKLADEHMRMEGHSMETAETKSFHVSFSQIPSVPKANEPFELEFMLHDEQGNPITDPEIQHETIQHVFVISEDLEEFFHIHPDHVAQPRENREFRISLLLSKVGRYRVFVDGSQKSSSKVSDIGWIEIGAPSEQ